MAKIDAFKTLQRACVACCGHISMGQNGLNCSCGPDPHHPFPAPQPPCPVPDLWDRVQREKVDPDEVTAESVDAVVPKRDLDGDWIAAPSESKPGSGAPDGNGPGGLGPKPNIPAKRIEPPE